MPTPIMKYFEYAHLPARLQEVSKNIFVVAEEMDSTLPDGPEKSAGLRKLLEAKDCFVRAALADQSVQTAQQRPIPITELASSGPGSRVLEVGHNEQGEIVINHPDLKPDANGVGHITFSKSQAVDFATTILKRVERLATGNKNG